jgi:hypothetical protein
MPRNCVQRPVEGIYDRTTSPSRGVKGFYREEILRATLIDEPMGAYGRLWPKEKNTVQ